MSFRSPKLYIQDILQACDDILNFTQGMKSAVALQNDRRTFLAVVFSLKNKSESNGSDFVCKVTNTSTGAVHLNKRMARSVRGWSAAIFNLKVLRMNSAKP
ncbi:MAG: hypothetical protein ACOYYI_16175 [Chloroflexota bacterium]